MSDSSQKHLVLASKPFHHATVERRKFIGASTSRQDSNEEDVMGKYFLGWLLGVPAVVLVLIYFFMN